METIAIQSLSPKGETHLSNLTAAQKHYIKVMGDPILHEKHKQIHRAQHHKFCDVCGHDYLSIYTHYKTQKHMKKLMAFNNATEPRQATLFPLDDQEIVT